MHVSAHNNMAAILKGVAELALKQQYRVHEWTGQFCDAMLEQDYRRTMMEGARHTFSLAVSVAALVFAMFAISDYFLLGPGERFQRIMAMRAVVVGSCLWVAFFVRHWGGNVYRHWLHALPLWVLATGVILIVPLRPESLPTQITAVVVATMAFFLLIPNLLTVALPASLFLNIGFLLAALQFTGIDAIVALRIALLLIMGVVVGFCALLRLESLQRKQYALLCEERGQNQLLHQEIARRKALEEQLRHVAEHDALTRLNNRAHFMMLANKSLQRCGVEKAPFSLFMIDVDHFKRINDTWGHLYGDWVLTRIAEVCEQSLRPGDVIGRFGGEEFIVALPNTTASDAQQVAERLKQRVAELASTGDMASLRPSVTIGVATAQDGHSELDDLIQRADELLYVGKRAGRDRVVC